MTDRLTTFAKYHLQPLTVVEMVAFIAALIAGWKLIALAILGLHVTRMGATALGAIRDR